MSRTDRVLSALLIAAVLMACYYVWVGQGEIDNLHARIDRVEAKIPKPRTPKPRAES